MLLPINLRLGVSVPKDAPEYADIVTRMGRAVRAATQKSAASVITRAPGRRLKYKVETEYQETEAGAEGRVFIPRKLGFTLPPGTRRHFIPGPAGSRAGASAIQQAKGYPLRFYWERVGAVVFFWSVDHPGYKGGNWGAQVWADAMTHAMEELDDVVGYIFQRWGGQVGVSY